MKICIVGNGIGGHVQVRSKAIAQMGHEVTVISPVPSPQVDVPLLYPKPSSSKSFLSSKFKSILYILDYYKLIRDCKSDITHIHFAAEFGAWLALAAGKSPLMVSTMGGDVFFKERGTLGKISTLLTKRLLARADLVTAKTPAMIERLQQFGTAPEQTMQLIWGVPTNVFKPEEKSDLRQRLNIDPSAKVIFSPRCAKRAYNIDKIICAFSHVHNKMPSSVLLVAECVFDQKYVDELHHLVDECCLSDSVRFLGYIPHTEIQHYYNIADVTISAAESDGLPQSFIESMACGTPNVLLNLPEYKDMIIDGENALLATLSEHSLADKIFTILENKDIGQKITEGGIAFVDKYADQENELNRLNCQYKRLTRDDYKTRIRAIDRLVAMTLIFTKILSSWISNKFSKLSTRRKPQP